MEIWCKTSLGKTWKGLIPALAPHHTAITALLDVFTSDNGVSPGLKGLVPAPAAGDAAAGKVLGVGGWTTLTAGGAAPISAEFVTYASNASLSNERVATDTATIDVNIATAGQIKWDVIANSIGPTQIDETATYTWSGNNTHSGNPIFSGAGTVTGSLTFDGDALHILDTDASHDLILTPGSNLTADHVLTLTTGDADRTITLSGNPTLADWFDQAVKSTSTPVFANVGTVGADPRIAMTETVTGGDYSINPVTNSGSLSFYADFNNEIANSSYYFYIDTTTAETLKVTTDTLALTATGAGATGAILELYHNSATPAVLDEVGRINFYGEDSGGAKQLYAAIGANIGNVTATTEAAAINFWTTSGGTLANVAAFGATAFNVISGYPIQVGGNTILNDVAGTTTLSNIDAIDATTAATFEASMETNIDTLPNLTSIQSLTVTLADAAADAVFGWDDSDSAYKNLAAADVRTALGLVIGTNVQAFDADLTTLSTAFTSASATGPASLALHEDTDNGTNKVTLTAPSSIATDKTITFQDVTGTVYVSGGTDVAVADGGTGGSDAATARTNLGLAIGTNVQAWDADLDALAALAGTDNIYYRSGAATWTSVTIGSGLAFAAGTLSATAGGIGGSTGSVDNALIRADGVGGSTIQAGASATLSDDAALTLTSAAAVSNLALVSTDAGAVGPALEFYHNSGTASAGDNVGNIYFYGKDGGGAKQLLVEMYATSDSISAGSEDGAFEIILTKDGGTGGSGSKFSFYRDSTNNRSCFYNSATDTLYLGHPSFVWDNAWITTIELGAAGSGDTSISRNAAGVIQVEGGIVPLENRANTFSVGQVITVSSLAVNLSLYSTDAGAIGPIMDFYHNSASPVAGDAIGRINFYGEDSAGNTELYAQIQSEIVDTTSTSEDGNLVFKADVAGAMTTLLTLAGTNNVSAVDLTVPDEAYDATAWNGSLEVPTKNAVRDKIETILGASGLTAASQAEMEAVTSNTVGATPAVFHYHPGSAKAWGKCSGSASTVNASYGLTSVTNGAAGINTWNWSVTFSSADYAAVTGQLGGGLAANNRSHYVTSQTTTTAVVLVERSDGADTDPTNHYIAAFGDL